MSIIFPWKYNSEQNYEPTQSASTLDHTHFMYIRRCFGGKQTSLSERPIFTQCPVGLKIGQESWEESLAMLWADLYLWKFLFFPPPHIQAHNKSESKFWKVRRMQRCQHFYCVPKNRTSFGESQDGGAQNYDRQKNFAKWSEGRVLGRAVIASSTCSSSWLEGV